jgi:hypothetical protein
MTLGQVGLVHHIIKFLSIKYKLNHFLMLIPGH